MGGIQKNRASHHLGRIIVLALSTLAVSNFILGSMIATKISLPIRNEPSGQPPLTTLAGDPFCRSLSGARARCAGNRTMIHTLVSNAGHLPFLVNALRSLRRSGMPWRPLVLSVGAGVCPALADVRDLRGRYVCVPYLERLFDQLRRDEPESVEQIRPHLRANVTSHDNHTQFSDIDATFYGWGSVEHKFLINAKLYALRDVLECGADAFITDTDVVFRRDPRPHFAIRGPKGDIVAQNDTNVNYELSLNSGFMYWKKTDGNLDLIQDIITVPPFWHIDQSRVNTRMYNRSTPHTLLDTYKFPNGHMFKDHFGELDDAVIFHANFNSKRHEKEGMLRKMGLWFQNETVR